MPRRTATRPLWPAPWGTLGTNNGMTAKQLVEELTTMIQEHGDLDVTVSHGRREYSLRHLGFIPDGPSPINEDKEGAQRPTDRFMMETEDDID